MVVLLASGPVVLLAQARPPIIDMHMHARAGSGVGPDGKPTPTPCTPASCVSPKPLHVGDSAILLRTLGAMEKYNIVKGFLSDADQNVDLWVRAAPGRFIRSTGIPQDLSNPGLPNVEKLRDGYRAGRLKGMGEIGTQYITIAPNDPRSLRSHFIRFARSFTLALGARRHRVIA